MFNLKLLKKLILTETEKKQLIKLAEQEIKEWKKFIDILKTK